MPTDTDRVPRATLEGWSTQVAPALLGLRLVSELGGRRVVVRLTEVEAYMGEDDPGSHAFRGPTPRTQIMYGAAGFLYVYFTYGMHWCANVVCGPAGSASAVLLRAGEVVEGADVARSRRPSARAEAELARGPARLTTALGIEGDQNGHDLVTDPQLWLEPAARPTSAPVRTGPRVGIRGDGGGGDRFPWRVLLGGGPPRPPPPPGETPPPGGAPGGNALGGGAEPPRGRGGRGWHG